MFLTGFDDHRHTVRTEAGEVSCVEIGTGPVALFVHGVATSAYLWQHLIPLLADTRSFLSAELVQAFLEPLLGTPAAAARCQELIAGLAPDDLLAAEPALRALLVPTLIVWATDDDFFDLKWAHWLRDTIPGARDLAEVAGGKLFFPHERAAELAPHLRHHWTTADRA
jgi:pimeloyl-ACP methyl ester carboxylesterase